MDGFLKNVLTKALLSLVLITSTQNLGAMVNPAPGPAQQVAAQQPPAVPVIVVNNPHAAQIAQHAAQNAQHAAQNAQHAAQLAQHAAANANAAAAQAPALTNRSRIIRRIAGGLSSFAKGCWWTIKFPLTMVRPLASHFLKISKELGLTALHCAEIIAYLYALDCFLYYMTPAASDFANFIHLSQWTPENLKNFFTVIAQHYKMGDLSTFINSIGYNIYNIYKTGGSFFPTALFCSAPIVCPTCPSTSVAEACSCLGSVCWCK